MTATARKRLTRHAPPEQARLDERIYVRCTTEERERYGAAASAARQNLTDWVKSQCDKGAPKKR